jgi:heptaprenyl diphosphate synthase
MTLESIYLDMRKDLVEIERELAAAIKTDQVVLYDASYQLFKAGGKRIRPVFVLLAGNFGNFNFAKLKTVAASLELVHMATLVHDDIIDNADRRRGKLTVKAEWDNRVAMSTGDYLLAKFLLLITELEDPRLHKLVSRALVQIVEGEIDQIRDLNKWDISFREYLRRIKRKTALLIALSTQLGALVSDADPEVVSNLHKYGYYTGMAFQIIDDVLDFTGTTEELGKPAGSDLRQGNITFPALYAYSYSPSSEQLKALIASGVTDQNIGEIIQLVKDSGGIEEAQILAEKYLRKAERALGKLPAIKERDTLFEVSQFIADRTY